MPRRRAGETLKEKMVAPEEGPIARMLGFGGMSPEETQQARELLGVAGVPSGYAGGEPPSLREILTSLGRWAGNALPMRGGLNVDRLHSPEIVNELYENANRAVDHLRPSSQRKWLHGEVDRALAGTNRPGEMSRFEPVMETTDTARDVLRLANPRLTSGDVISSGGTLNLRAALLEDYPRLLFQEQPGELTRLMILLRKAR